MPVFSDEPIAPPTVEAALRWATQWLRSATGQPRLEAEILLSSLLGMSRASLFAHPEAELEPVERRTYAQWVMERAAHRPLPYITGEVEFYGLRFAVSEAVLIPRPETELLVEVALAWLAHHPHAVGADVCTGSGCIAATLARFEAGVRFCATDISMEALRVAQANVRWLRVEDRVHLVQGDLLTMCRGPLDFIFSNPPYVATGEWEKLPPSVRREPPVALLGGPDGLEVVRRLLAQAARRLRPGGLLLVEVGAQQGEAVLAMAQQHFPRSSIRMLRDLADRPRLLRVVRGE